MKFIYHLFILSLFLYLLIPLNSAETSTDNFDVKWDCTHSIISHECKISVQNLELINREINIISTISDTNFITSDISDLKLFEWKLVPYTYTVDHYDTVNHSVWNDTNQTWNNYTEQIYNYTETLNSEKLDWKSAKQNALNPTSNKVDADYGLMLIPKYNSKDKGDGTINGTKIFKLSWNTPIVRTGDGWGSAGKMALWLDGVEHHPYWNTSYLGRVPITITTSGNSTSAWYPKLENITWLPEMQDDFDDIRFTNSTGGTELPYWIESKVNESYANVWVNLSDAITDPGTGTVWMYYGNGDITDGSEGESVFLNTADVGFDSSTGWTSFGAAVFTIADSKMTYNYTADQGGMYSSVSLPGEFIYDFEWTIVGAQASHAIGLYDFNTNEVYNYQNAIYILHDSSDLFLYLIKAGAYASTYTTKLGDGTYYCTIKRIGDTAYFNAYSDAARTTSIKALSGSVAGIGTLTYVNPSKSHHTVTITATGSVDSAYVRKYIANEPTSSVGTAQYYTDSLLYNATENYNHTIESDGTITANRSIDAADDTNWTAYGDDTNWIFTTSVTPAGNTNFTLNGGVLYNFTVANMTASTEYSVNNGSEVGTFTTDGDGIAIFEIDLIADDYTVAQTVAGNTSPVISGESPITPYASTTVDEVTFSATTDQSNSNNKWLINGSLLEWDNTTSSPSYTNSSPVAGSYNITLISYNSSDSTKSNQTTWIWTVTNELGNIPGIVNGVFAFETNTIPSNATILNRKNDSIITIGISVDWDSIDATIWGNVKNAIYYAYSQNMRSSLTLNFSGDYTDNVYWTDVKINFTNYLPDLTVDPYQADLHYITFGFTNMTASNIEKVNFANNVTFNMSANLNHKINIISKENLDGFGNYISVSPIKYVILTSESGWIDDEVRILRGNTTKSRSYEGNVSFLSDVNSYRVNALNKIRGTSNISGQYSETDTVKIDNGDVILYNNGSSTSNVTIASADSGYYFDIINDVYLNHSSGGTLHFNVSAYSFTYVIKDTLSKILYVDNTSSNLWGGDTTLNKTDDLTNGTTPPASYIWAGESTDARFELWDATYKKDNVFMIHYEWINSSVVTDYSEYKVIIIADYNAAEINTILAQNSNVYGYISVADYADTTSWENSTKLKIDDWVDNYSVNIFIDGIDGAVSGTNFSTRFKVVTDYSRATKGVSTILNSYTVYNEFATYGDMIMKESAFSRWGGDVSTPTYSWEDMTIEKERADYYTSHNITVLGMSFGEVDDYNKMAFDAHAFAVLYGFDGRNSWKYGQPNFQAQREVYIPDWGNMLESTYTETSATDWNRLYEIGRVHINPVDHTYSIDNNINVNSITFYIHLYSGGVGAGDRNVYLYVNNMTNNYTLPYDTPSTGVWYNKSVTINVEDYNTTGHYYVYGYTRPDSGGWNFLGEYDKTGSGIHTWYDTTAINLPANYTGQTWNSIQLDRNFAVALNINYTTSTFLDEIEDKITQTLTDNTVNYSVNLTSINNYPDTPTWSGVVAHPNSDAISNTYFKASNGTWVLGSSATVVSDTTSSVLDWNYTTIDGEQYGAVRDTDFNYRYLFPHLSTQEAYTEQTQEYIPPVPTGLSNLTGNFWVNYTWNVGVGNITDSYNVSQNSTWTNGTTDTYFNSSVGVHGYSNIIVYAYNNSGTGTLSESSITDNVTVPNNAIIISDVLTTYSMNEGETLSIDANYTDADGDTGTFADNSTLWNVNTSTGIVSWVSNVNGTYNWEINVTDGYGSVSTQAFNVIINNNSFEFSNEAVSPVTILQGATSTVSIDINDLDGTISTAIVKIKGTNYTMTHGSGDTWSYTYSNTAFVGKHYVTNFYAQDNGSSWNSTTSNLYIEVLDSSGIGGGAGTYPIVTPTPTVTPTPEINITIPVVNFSLPTLYKIVTGEGFSFFKINFGIDDPIYNKTVEYKNIIDCTIIDGNLVSACKIVDNNVILLTKPTLKGIYNYHKGYVQLKDAENLIYDIPVEIITIDAMGWIDIPRLQIDGIPNILFEKDSMTNEMIGIRLWWIFGILGLVVYRYGKKKKE